MPPPPTFNYYEALGVEKTATTQEIVTAYRILAKVHHPDRNPENQQAATAEFQKIQIAHETLTDDRSRAIYDARSAPRTTAQGYRSSPYHGAFDSDSDFEYSNSFFEDSDDEDEVFGFFFRGRGPSHFSSGARVREEFDRIRREQEAQDHAHRQFFVKEVQRRKEAEEAIAKARAARKEAEEKKRVEQRAELLKQQREQQHATWAEVGAKTVEEKQAACFHKGFLAKEKQQRKFQCGDCGVKRGMVGFRCPHCKVLFCQLCMNEINAARDDQ